MKLDLQSMESGKIDFLAKKLNLNEHPEGGFYAEVYRQKKRYTFHEFEGERNLSTHIYFLLTKDNFSALHKIKSDEMWHFYDGDSIHIHCIYPNGKYELKKLGRDLNDGQSYFHLVEAGVWFGSESVGDQRYALCGCSVSPGFDFNDFELAENVKLSKEFPEHEPLIKRLTRL